MKKTLVLASLLAAFGAASAQSSVTIYGQVQFGVFKSAAQTIRLDSNNGDSRLGFRGTEALGGGLNATFDLQHRFSAESGSFDGTTNARPFWQGKSTVGLNGGFGAIEMGRQLTAFQGPVGAQDPFGVSTAGSTHVLNGYATDPSTAASGGGLGRADVINYTSPVIAGGIVAAVGFGPKRTAVNGTNTLAASDLKSYWVGYSAGPLTAGLGGETNRVGDKITAMLATYDLGAAKLFVGTQRTDTVATVGSKESATNFGLTAPLGAVLIKAGFKNSKAEGTGVKTTKLGLGADYRLSARTVVSANMGRTAPAGVAASSGYDLFLQHNF